MEIYYENSIREKLYLDRWPTAIEDVSVLFGNEWKYDAIEDREKNRSEESEFYRTSMQKKINVQVFADSEKEFKECIDRIGEMTEKDILMKKPGKLWCGEYYLECYIVENEKKDYDDLFYAVDIPITIVSFRPFWIRKSEYSFRISEVSSTNNKRYRYKYPYRYANGMNDKYVVNPHFSDSNFKLIIYGPAVNPLISIGEVPHLTNIVLEQDERLEIDSRAGTVVKIIKNGECINAFHNRQKGRKFFRKIGPGRQNIVWPGTFAFDLVIFEERSEPKCS